MKEKSAETKLSTKEKVCYGAGDAGNGLAVSSIGIFFLKYLTDVAGLSPQAAGLAMVIGRLWDAVTDPLMGWITDHTKSRWGKRRPYLLFGAIPFGVAYFALWVVPEFPREWMIFAYVSIAFLIFNTCLTVIFVPYTSLTAAITNDYNERTSLTGYRMAISLSSICIGAVVPSALVIWITSTDGALLLEQLSINSLFGDWAGSARQGYALMAGLFMLLMIASAWTTFFGTRERDVEESNQTSVTPFTYASSILNELQGNRPFRVSVLILLITNTAATFVAVNLPYFIHYVIDLERQQTPILMALFFTAICCVPFWVRVAQRFGKAESYRVAMVCYAVVLILLPALPEQSQILATVLACIAGIFHSAALVLPWAMVPDVVEYDQLKTGKRREGLFYGGTTFCYKLATTIPLFVTSWVLGEVGYVPHELQSDNVVFSIKSLIGPTPAVLLIIAALLSMRYPLTAAKHHQIVQALAESKKLGEEKA